MNNYYFAALWLRGLSHRAINLLAKHEIDSDHKLVRLTEQQMRSWRGCGEKTLDEINDHADFVERAMMRQEQ